MNILKAWRLYRLYEEVKDMNSKVLVRLALVVVAAVCGAAGSQLGVGDAVSVSDLFSVAVAAAMSYLAKSPLAK